MKGESSRSPRSLNPRSRSQREEDDVSRSPVFDTEMESSWDKIPPELLHEILTRIEASESTWPLRKHVIACAGVCWSWRNFMKEIVEASVVPRVMTFPISVKQPGPRGSLLQCFIKRNRIAQTYHLYLGLTQGSTDDGKFLLAARRFKRTTCNEYLISLDPYNISKGNDTYVGKLRSNFLGTKFTTYDGQPVHVSDMVLRNCSTHLMGSKPKVPVGNYPVAHISYDLNTMGPRGPRSMRCIMDSIPASTIKPGSVDPLQTFGSKSHRKDPSGIFPARKEEKLVLKNKSPRWHERLQCWCLNFRGRVTVASVKNFQLSVSPDDGRVGPEHEEVILQFGKAGKDLFTMDYRYPISAFQAFAICLSSFDAKIACE